MDNSNIKISPEALIAATQNIKEKNFWLKKLSGELQKSHFYYDYPKKPSGTQERRFNRKEFSLNQELFSKLSQLSNASDLRLHMILVTGLVILMEKYTGNKDIIIGVPIYKQDISTYQYPSPDININMDFINTVLPLRNQLEESMTFIELLLQVKQTIAEAAEHVNYPLRVLLEQLDLLFSWEEEDDFPLFDVSLMLENVHDKKYLQHTKHNVSFSLVRKESALKGVVEYNAFLYHEETIKRMINHFINIFKQVLFNVNVRIGEVEMLSDDDKRALIYEFNHTGMAYSKDKTIHQLFEEQVEQTPEATAVSFPIDLTDIFTESSCFKANPYIFQYDLDNLADRAFSFSHSPGGTHHKITFKLLKTHCHNTVVVNTNMARLIESFDGEHNLQSIFSHLKDSTSTLTLNEVPFIIYSVEKGDLLEITHDFDQPAVVFSNMDYEDFVRLVKILYENHLIELAAFNSHTPGDESVSPDDFFFEEPFDTSIRLKQLLEPQERLSKTKAEVLLLGDTPGMPTTGLLYIASFLRRNQVTAVCRFYDGAWNYQLMREDIQELLESIQPRVVAISMKWFLYIARVLEMCQVVREYSNNTNIPIKIVVGGNTASYYWDKLINHECIDYIIRGDGELPLLKICRDEHESHIPNCVYKNKKDGRVIQSPITYIKDETNSPNIYLSHLSEILLSDTFALFGTFFIYTHLGCSMNCFYCGGCSQAQEKTFNRKGIFIRTVEEVRKDIIEARPYISTFQFDFDIPQKNLVEYCRQIWEGIDLSGHFCSISILRLPPGPLIELAARTFKYVYWDIDILTLSERHRNQLFSLGIVKPQPTDAEILGCLRQCDPYTNSEIRLNLITGLPCFLPEDIDIGEKFLSTIKTGHRSFSALHWARLHAQPGAFIAENAEKYDMHSFASTFEDFWEYSKKNFNSQSFHQHSRLEYLNYPYVYYNHDPLNSRITLYYTETNRKIQQYMEKRRFVQMPCETLTYAQLDKKANQLAQQLRSRGVVPDTIVGILMERSVEMMVAIIAILKAGGAYLPIDPEYPEERIRYMLADSNAKLFLTDYKDNIPVGTGGLAPLYLPLANHPVTRNPQLAMSPRNLAYVIYTSGSTGSPKGVMLEHQNVNNLLLGLKERIYSKYEKKLNIALISPYVFDASVKQIFGALLQGHCLHIVPEHIRKNTEKLVEFYLENKIDISDGTPALISLLMESGISPVKEFLIGGEALSQRRVQDFFNHFDFERGVPFITNLYGPTECCVDSTSFTVTKEDIPLAENIPIGKPMPNVQVYILSGENRLRPIGSVGEICIAGDGVARGYLNNPALTAEKFDQDFQDDQDDQDKKENKTDTDKLEHKNVTIDKSFCGGPGGGFFKKSPLAVGDKIYKTHDLGRWLPDGNLEFLGRLDLQVKIRGYRIELEEIEHQLLVHPLVEEAVVTLRDDLEGDSSLCAYIVPKKEQVYNGISNQEVRELKVEDPQQSVVRRFEDKAAQQPLEIAVEGYENRNPMTYEFLDKRAIRIARIINSSKFKYKNRHRLSREEKTRYKRQMLLHGWGVEAQEKLKSTTVFAAGAGGIGSAIIQQLALVGIGTIIICDHDVVELSNLNRQVLHDESRIGMSKAHSAKMTVKRINPHVNVAVFQQKITRENIHELVGDAAIIFDCVDDLETKFILSECAFARQIPHVLSAMIEINSYAAILHPPLTPCFFCLHDQGKLEEIRQLRQANDNYEKEPFPVVSPSLFVTTGFVCNEALKILLGQENPAYNKFFLFNQKGSMAIVDTTGYKQMTYSFNSHFKQISKKQGFDWEKCWRGNFLEELSITPDPNCPLCNQSQPNSVRKTISIKSSRRDISSAGNWQTCALFIDPEDKYLLPEAFLGILKAGKTAVPIASGCSREQSIEILDRSEAGLIVTSSKALKAAEQLRDSVHKGIPIINLDALADEEEDEDISMESLNMNIEIEPGKIDCILYPTGSSCAAATITSDDSIHAAVTDIYNALLKGDVISSHPYSLLPSDLRKYVMTKLPEYMVPSYFVQIEKMPLTSNGKIDRKALPEPEAVGSSEEYAPPADEFEEKLVRIWSEILNIEKEKISTTNNFFQLGGNSLHLIMLVSKIYKAFGIEIAITQIYRDPVIKEISKHIKENKFVDEPVALLNQLTPRKVFCFPPAVGFGVAYQGLASMIDDYSFYSFNYIEDDDRLSKYVDIITKFQPIGPIILLGWSVAGGLVFEVANALENVGCNVSDILLVDSFWNGNRTRREFNQDDEAFMRHIENRLKDMELEFLKEKARKKMEAYLTYNLNISQLHVISAEIHLVLSEESQTEERPSWDKYTRKSVTTYNGCGSHTYMFSPGYLEKNAELIREILGKISFVEGI
jgi:amino acid adenylation domain-containing protein